MSTNLLESPEVGSSRWNPKVASALSLMLVFLVGAVLGAVTMDQVVHNRRQAPSFDTTTGKAAYFARLRKDLDLTPQQSDLIESILNDLWHDYRSVLNDSKVRVEQVLNETQRQKFERILQDPKALAAPDSPRQTH
jgi:hypothetical protein